MKASSGVDAGRYLRLGVQGGILSVIAATLVIFFTVESKTWSHLSQFNWWFVPLVLFVVVTAWLCNSGRVYVNARALGHKLSYAQSIAVSLSTEFGIAASPAGMGGAAIRLYLLKKAGVPMTRGGTMLTVDAAVDLMFFTLLTPIAVYYIFADSSWTALFENFSGWQLALVIALPVALIFLVVIFFQTGLWTKVMHRVAHATPFGRRRRWPGRLRVFRRELRRTLRRTWLTTRFMFNRRRPALLLNFLLASVQWLCRYGTLPLILLGFGALENPFPLVLIQGCLFLFGMLVFLPGGGGGVEVATAFILGFFVPLPLVGIVLAFWRFATYHLYLIAGGCLFYYVTGHMDKVFPRRKR